MDDDKTIIRPRPGGRADASTRASESESEQLTIIRPRPGGERDDATVIRPRPPTPFTDELSAATQIRPRRRGAPVTLVLNEREGFDDRLAEVAADLLVLSSQLRRLHASVNVAQLHRQTVQAVQRFHQRAAEAQLASRSVSQASYLLCSLLDETLLNTSWGETSSWSQNSLLRIFHRETYGGARAFEMIEEALGRPRTDLGFLEVSYLCLSLGFEGKYRIEPRGKIRLEQLRKEIYLVLGEQRDRFRKEIAPGIAPALGVRRRLHSFLSLWVLAALLALATFAAYGQLLFGLNKRSDAVLAELAALIPPVDEALSSNAVSRPEIMRLRELLAPEIQRGVLKVEEHGTRLSVVLQSEALFAPGSADIVESVLPILDKIGKALEVTEGRVIVTGHTDSSAIRTARFPSNWHLSLARASEVVKYMSTVASLRGRMLPEGRGDSEPVAANDTAEGRAMNRRVAIDVHQVGNR